MPLLVAEEKTLLPQLSPVVLGDACGTSWVQPAARWKEIKASLQALAAGRLQTTSSAAPGPGTWNSQRPLTLQVLSREASAGGRPCSGGEAARRLGSVGMLLCVTLYTSWCPVLKSDFVFLNRTVTAILQKTLDKTHRQYHGSYIFKWCVHLYLPSNPVELL